MIRTVEDVKRFWSKRAMGSRQTRTMSHEPVWKFSCDGHSLTGNYSDDMAARLLLAMIKEAK